MEDVKRNKIAQLRRLSYGEALVQEFWGNVGCLSIAITTGLLWPINAPSMRQIELFSHLQPIIIIISYMKPYKLFILNKVSWWS